MESSRHGALPQPVACLPLTSLLSVCLYVCGRVAAGHEHKVGGFRGGPGWSLSPTLSGRGSLPLPLILPPPTQHRRQQMLLVSLHFNRFTSMPLCVTEKLGVNPILRTQWNSLLEEHIGKSLWEVNNNHPLVQLLRQCLKRSSWKVFPMISS